MTRETITAAEREAEDAAFDARVERREAIVREFCRVMGWDYKTSPVWTGIRKVALAEAIPLGLEKAEEILTRLDEAFWLIDQLQCLAVEYPSLYTQAQKWKARNEVPQVQAVCPSHEG